MQTTTQSQSSMTVAVTGTRTWRGLKTGDRDGTMARSATRWRFLEAGESEE